MVPCTNSLTIKEIMTPETLKSYSVFLINEGQFFPDLKDCVMDLVETHNKIVYVCGLDGDFKRNGFSQIMELIPLADSIVKKRSICKSCEDGTPALFSHRITNETAVKVIGADNYIPLCRKCYIEHTKM
jgi:thymidine kinase